MIRGEDGGNEGNERSEEKACGESVFRFRKRMRKPKTTVVVELNVN